MQLLYYVLCSQSAQLIILTCKIYLLPKWSAALEDSDETSDMIFICTD